MPVIFLQKNRPWATACLITLLVLILSACSVFAETDPLNSLEQQLLNQTFSTESLEQRVIRLEGIIFGQPQPGDIVIRKQHLLEMTEKFQSQTQSQYQPQPYTSSPSTSPITHGNRYLPGTSEPQGYSYQNTDATEYPAVTRIERKVFSRDFVNDNIYRRLSRLEKRVFGTEAPQKALADRVDTLSAKLQMSPEYATSGNSVLDSLPGGNGQYTTTSMDTYTKLESLEKNVFDGKTFSDLMITQRLDQLENRIDGKTYLGESVDTRLNRLIGRVAYRGKPYQPPRYSTGHQPGSQTTTNPGFRTYSTPNTYSPPSSTGQNIQIGSSIGSSSTHQYSQEMLDMLPPNIRNQLSGGNTQTYTTRSSGFNNFGVGSGFGNTRTTTQNSYTTAAPGSVIIRESTRLPGISTFGANTGTTSRNLLTNPLNRYTGIGGTTSYTRSYTTDPYGNPAGGYTTYQQQTPYGQYNTISPLGLNANVINQLNQLENAVYGQVNNGQPLPARLNALEMSLIGQTYAGAPYQDRINNLIRTRQYQSLGNSLGRGTLGNIGRTAGSLLFGMPLNGPQNTPNPFPVQTMP
ncbi:MAG: hypothetical protein KTR14_10060 [Vampirovibrio sp.]|nr:hypothetical protein [Vampirovibrio sp.]